MEQMEKIGSSVAVFLKKVLGAADAKVIRIAKADGGWETEAEVYEESVLIKSLGLPSRVRDRNIYEVKLSDSLEIESYARKS